MSLIGIFSYTGLEESTNEVMEWIATLGGEFVRFNGEELGENGFSLTFSDQKDKGGVNIDDASYTLDKIRVVWYRRGGSLEFPVLEGIEDRDFRGEIEQHMKAETRSARKALYYALDHATWLSRPETAVPHKIGQLLEARALGISVPRTLVTTEKKALIEFEKDAGPLIVKCIGDVAMFRNEKVSFGNYTESVAPEFVASLPDRFFPALFQEMVPKKWEIRSFFFKGRFYSMAIFSQKDSRTMVDFRRYNFKDPNRNVPFQLSSDLEEKLRRLMAVLKLETGSLDLIRAENGKTYFLEVNPLGQFGMVSQPCNYHLERKIAQYLVDKDRA